MNQKIIIGNWKNYLNYEESISLSKAISNINENIEDRRKSILEGINITHKNSNFSGKSESVDENASFLKKM